ncbi:MAG TPA: hypothetical protein VMV45_01835 [Casimicrobiaceae bacterium]|nr:hypothetical protein [Casimicrobiaceae bacterium]
MPDSVTKIVAIVLGATAMIAGRAFAAPPHMQPDYDLGCYADSICHGTHEAAKKRKQPAEVDRDTLPAPDPLSPEVSVVENSGTRDSHVEPERSIDRT